MSGFDWSVVLIIPAALREKANLLACALGHDQVPGRTFDVQLSADGAEPASHYGCHTWAQTSFVQMFEAAKQGALPDIEWSEFSLSVEDVQEVVAELIVSAEIGSDGAAHFAQVLAAQGLAKLQTPEEV